MYNERNIHKLEIQLRNLHRQRGGSLPGNIVESMKNIDLSDPKIRLFIMASPYLLSAAKKLATFGYQKFNDLISSGDPKYVSDENAVHAPSYNFLGPGTSINQRINVNPVNETDAQAKKHDVAYNYINMQYKDGKIDKATADRMTRIADEQFKTNLQKVNTESIKEKIINKGAEAIIGAKNGLEDVGILDKGHFVGYGRPLRKLKQKALKIGAGTKYQNKMTRMNKLLSLLGAKIIAKNNKRYRKQSGGNLKGILDEIGSSFNKFGYDTKNFFEHSIPNEIYYKPTGAIVSTAKDIYNKTLGF